MMTRPLRRRLLGGLLALALLIIAANAWVIWRGSARVVPELAQLPENEVGLVLGTAPTLSRVRKDLAPRMRLASGRFA